MIKVGDIVKVTGKTLCGGEEKECIPIGTICRVVETEDNAKGKPIIGIVSVTYDHEPYWYLVFDVEKMTLQESKSVVSVNKLIETFTDMANRETLLARGGVSQHDLLLQIIGTITKVAMEESE